MDRAHRLGQTKVVNVYRLITKGTLEEKIMGYVCSDFICLRNTHSRIQFATLQIEHCTLCGHAAKCRAGYDGHQPRPGPVQSTQPKRKRRPLQNERRKIPTVQFRKRNCSLGWKTCRQKTSIRAWISAHSWVQLGDSDRSDRHSQTYSASH
jgi:hypothetical protein